MRRPATFLGVALALTACGSSVAGSTAASSPAAHARRCGPANATTLAASRAARVYALNGGVYGCTLRAGRSYRLGLLDRCITGMRVAPIAVTGGLAAYGLERCGVDTGSSEVVVRELTHGKQLRRLSSTTGAIGPESYELVRSLVLRSDGAVAWISSASSLVRHRDAVQVHKADRRGITLLDSGAAINPRSLRPRGSTVTWRHGNVTRSATLA